MDQNEPPHVYKNDYYCDICLRFSNNPFMYGELKTKKVSKEKYIDVHYYCLLSCNYIPQRGRDTEGILGFLEKDILDSIPKFNENKCYICKQSRAGVKCCVKDCEKTWHYICGRNYRCITQFTGEFNSFCADHLPISNIIKPVGYVYCTACWGIISDKSDAHCIFSSCCAELLNDPNVTEHFVKNECFTHTKCIQKYVINAGYDSTCINCSGDKIPKKEWQEQMRMRGIYVPKKMAEWENDEDFKSQVKNKCKVLGCKNPESTKNVWTCYACGCFPAHLDCVGVESVKNYLCKNCYDQTFVNMLPYDSYELTDS